MCEEIRTQVISLEQQQDEKNFFNHSFVNEKTNGNTTSNNCNDTHERNTVTQSTEKGTTTTTATTTRKRTKDMMIRELEKELAIAKEDLGQYKVYMKQKELEYEEKLRVDRLHFQNTNDALERKCREEVRQMKSDARLVIDFIRKKANETLAENDAKHMADTQTKLETLKSSLQWNFHTRLDTLAQKMKHTVLEEKQGIHHRNMHTTNNNNNNNDNDRCIPKSVISKRNETNVNKKNNHTKFNNNNKRNHYQNNTIPTDESEYGTTSEDDSISTKYDDDDVDSNVTLVDRGVMMYNKQQRNKGPNKVMKKLTETQWLKSRVKELENWTDTLTTALRSGAHLKGMNGEFFTYRDDDAGTSKSDNHKSGSSLSSYDTPTNNGNSEGPARNNNVCHLDQSSILKRSKRKSNIVPPSPPRRK